MLLAFLLLLSTHDATLKPAPLQAGDTVAFVLPSGAIKNDVGLKEEAKRSQEEGFRVVLPAKPDRRESYLAGTDAERAEELNQAIRDPKVKAIFPARGGYGLTRILDQLDYAALRKHPKIITGFSDTTALHLAIAAKANIVTFHTPVPMRQVSREAEPAFTRDCFRSLLVSKKPAMLPWTLPHPDRQPAVEALTKGKAQGKLMGGNLTMISSTLGTPYALQPAGKLLFLEDVHEAPYRIDRHLSQLRLAGVLDQVNGVILGSFTSDDPKEAAEMDRVLRSYFTNFRVPVIWKFPVGHVPYNVTIPLNVEAALDADQGKVSLLESPLKD